MVEKSYGYEMEVDVVAITRDIKKRRQIITIRGDTNISSIMVKVQFQLVLVHGAFEVLAKEWC